MCLQQCLHILPYGIVVCLPSYNSTAMLRSWVVLSLASTVSIGRGRGERFFPKRVLAVGAGMCSATDTKQGCRQQQCVANLSIPCVSSSDATLLLFTVPMFHSLALRTGEPIISLKFAVAVAVGKSSPAPAMCSTLLTCCSTRCT